MCNICNKVQELFRNVTCFFAVLLCILFGVYAEFHNYSLFSDFLFILAILISSFWLKIQLFDLKKFWEFAYVCAITAALGYLICQLPPDFRKHFGKGILKHFNIS